MNSAPSVFMSLGDDRFESTARASGPWSEAFCHGGAPAALLASVISQAPSAAPMSLARFTVDLMRAVPVGEPLHVLIRDRHVGRQVLVTEADLIAGDVAVARATGLRLLGRPAGPGPQVMDPPEEPHIPMPGGFSEQFRIVPTSGGFGHLGPAEVWFRLDTALRDDAGLTALERCVAAADFGSGIAHEHPFSDWRFPSLDLSIGFVRPPAGEWIRLRSRWLAREEGATPCVTELADLHGPFGTAFQMVLIQPRRADA